MKTGSFIYNNRDFIDSECVKIYFFLTNESEENKPIFVKKNQDYVTKIFQKSKKNNVCSPK